MTLLHFIVRTYMRECGGALAAACALPVPEPGDVARAAALDFADVAASLDTLSKNLAGQSSHRPPAVPCWTRVSPLRHSARSLALLVLPSPATLTSSVQNRLVVKNNSSGNEPKLSLSRPGDRRPPRSTWPMWPRTSTRCLKISQVSTVSRICCRAKEDDNVAAHLAMLSKNLGDW